MGEQVLADHIRSSGSWNAVPFECRVCNVSFQRQCALCAHDKVHIDGGPSCYSCKLCGRYFQGTRVFQVHLQEVHNCESSEVEQWNKLSELNHSSATPDASLAYVVGSIYDSNNTERVSLPSKGSSSVDLASTVPLRALDSSGARSEAPYSLVDPSAAPASVSCSASNSTVAQGSILYSSSDFAIAPTSVSLGASDFALIPENIVPDILGSEGVPTSVLRRVLGCSVTPTSVQHSAMHSTCVSTSVLHDALSSAGVSTSVLHGASHITVAPESVIRLDMGSANVPTRLTVPWSRDFQETSSADKLCDDFDLSSENRQFSSLASESSPYTCYCCGHNFPNEKQLKKHLMENPAVKQLSSLHIEQLELQDERKALQPGNEPGTHDKFSPVAGQQLGSVMISPPRTQMGFYNHDQMVVNEQSVILPNQPAQISHPCYSCPVSPHLQHTRIPVVRDQPPRQLCSLPTGLPESSCSSLLVNYSQQYAFSASMNEQMCGKARNNSTALEPHSEICVRDLCQTPGVSRGHLLSVSNASCQHCAVISRVDLNDSSFPVGNKCAMDYHALPPSVPLVHNITIGTDYQSSSGLVSDTGEAHRPACSEFAVDTDECYSMTPKEGCEGLAQTMKTEPRHHYDDSTEDGRTFLDGTSASFQPLIENTVSLRELQPGSIVDVESLQTATKQQQIFCGEVLIIKSQNESSDSGEIDCEENGNHTSTLASRTFYGLSSSPDKSPKNRLIVAGTLSFHSEKNESRKFKQFNSSSGRRSSAKLFTCKVCDEKFNRVGVMRYHARIHTSERGCLKRLKKSKLLKASRELAIKSLPCCSRETCELESRTGTSALNSRFDCNTSKRNAECMTMSIHQPRNSGLTSDGTSRRIDLGGIYTCPYCKNKCRSLSSLCTHLRQSHANNLYKCMLCMATFFSCMSLILHTKRHHLDAVFLSCSFCQFQCPGIGNLERHLRTHKQFKLNAYSFCTDTSAQSSHLVGVRKHARLVSLESVESVGGQCQEYDTSLPYICSYCDQKFSRIGTLCCHLSIHSGVSPSNTGRSSRVACPMDSRVPNVGDYRGNTTHIHVARTSFGEQKPSNDEHSVPSAVMDTSINQHAVSCHANRSSSVSDECLSFPPQPVNPSCSYKCPFCDKKFSRIGTLHCHQFIHCGSTADKQSIGANRPSTLNIAIDHVITGDANVKRRRLCVKKPFNRKRFLQTLATETMSSKYFLGNIADGLRSNAEGSPGASQHPTNTSNSYKCSLCILEFQDIHKLLRHLSVHIGGKPYRCIQCGHLFTRKHGIHEHLLWHTVSEAKFHVKLHHKPVSDDTVCVTMRVGNSITVSRQPNIASSHLFDPKLVWRPVVELKRHDISDFTGLSQSATLSDSCFRVNSGASTNKVSMKQVICNTVRRGRVNLSPASTSCLSTLISSEGEKAGRTSTKPIPARKSISSKYDVDHLPAARKKYKCQLCDKTFKTMSSLFAHRWFFHKLRIKSCTFCTQSFPSTRSLLEHEKIHSCNKSCAR